MTEQQKKEQERIIAEGTAQDAYEFAKSVDGADVLRLQDVVLEKDKTGEVVYKIAKDVKGCDLAKAQDVFMSDDWEHFEWGWRYEFAKNIEGIDHMKMAEFLQTPEFWENGADDEDLYYFMKEVPGANVKLFENWLSDAEWCYKFAKEFKGVDIGVLVNTIYEKANEEHWLNEDFYRYGDEEWVYKIAREIEGADIKKLSCCLSVPEDCYNFAKEFKNVDIKKMSQNIDFWNDEEFEWFIKFAKEVEGADIKTMQSKIENKKLMIRFIQEVDGASLDGVSTEQILKWEDEKLCLRLAQQRKLGKEDFEKVQKFIIECKDDEVKSLFAATVKGADVYAICKSMEETNELMDNLISSLCQEAVEKKHYKQCIKLAELGEKISDENVTRLAKTVVESKKVEYMLKFTDKCADRHNGVDVFDLMYNSLAESKNVKGLEEFVEDAFLKTGWTPDEKMQDEIEEMKFEKYLQKQKKDDGRGEKK